MCSGVGVKVGNLACSAYLITTSAKNIVVQQSRTGCNTECFLTVEGTAIESDCMHFNSGHMSSSFYGLETRLGVCAANQCNKLFMTVLRNLSHHFVLFSEKLI